MTREPDGEHRPTGAMEPEWSKIVGAAVGRLITVLVVAWLVDVVGRDLLARFPYPLTAVIANGTNCVIDWDPKREPRVWAPANAAVTNNDPPAH